jgi:hypothetical protein
MFSIANLSHIHHIGYSDVFECGIVCVLCFGQLVFLGLCKFPGKIYYFDVGFGYCTATT